MTIGDVHGRDTWKFMTHGSSYEFEQWVIMIEAGANPNDELFKNDYPYFNVDKIIFIGDYVDSFTISNVAIKKNLEDIILFKKSMAKYNIINFELKLSSFLINDNIKTEDIIKKTTIPDNQKICFLFN